MGNLRAGAARAVITPSIGASIRGYYHERLARDIHDDLYAKSLVLERDGTSLAIVVCDLIGLAKEYIDRARSRAAEITGIPPANVLVACTHTHFGPGVARGINKIGDVDCVDWLPDRIADSIRMAQNRLRPAMIGHASGQCPKECHNRRYLMKDGAVVTNPGYMNPNIVKPVGPTDPEVALLAVLDSDRTPIAALCNYSLHYVGGCGPDSAVVDYSISADYFGAFDRALQRMAGGDFVAIMMNGCCGDINNIDVFKPAPDCPEPRYQINRVADVVAAEAYKAWRGIRLTDYQLSPELAAANHSLVLKRRAVTEDQVAAAKRTLNAPEPDSLGDRDWLESDTIVTLSEMPLERETQIQAMRIGDVGLVGIPGEVFVEFGLDIKWRSPFARPLVSELANDDIQYIPTAAAIDQGSYETYTTLWPRGTGEAMADTAVGLLAELAD